MNLKFNSKIGKMMELRLLHNSQSFLHLLTWTSSAKKRMRKEINVYQVDWSMIKLKFRMKAQGLRSGKKEKSVWSQNEQDQDSQDIELMMSIPISILHEWKDCMKITRSHYENSVHFERWDHTPDNLMRQAEWAIFLNRWS